jgi:hypothetical protein
MSENKNSNVEHPNVGPGAKPGVSREQRISDEGLQRLKKHLESGVRVSDAVLKQWVKRYGNDARAIIEKYKLKRDG